MIFCSSCQHELPDNSRFCGYCGAKVEMPEDVSPQTASSKPDNSETGHNTQFGLTPAANGAPPDPAHTSQIIETISGSVGGDILSDRSQSGDSAETADAGDAANVSEAASQSADSAPEIASAGDFKLSAAKDLENDAAETDETDAQSGENDAAETDEIDAQSGENDAAETDEIDAQSGEHAEKDGAAGIRETPEAQQTPSDGADKESCAGEKESCAGGENDAQIAEDGENGEDDEDDEDIRELERLLAERKARKKNKRAAAETKTSDDIKTDAALPESASEPAAAIGDDKNASSESAGKDNQTHQKDDSANAKTETEAAKPGIGDIKAEETPKNEEPQKSEESSKIEENTEKDSKDDAENDADGKENAEASNQKTEDAANGEKDNVADNRSTAEVSEKGGDARALKRNKKKRQRWNADNRANASDDAPSDAGNSEADRAGASESNDQNGEEDDRRIQAETLEKLDKAAKKSELENSGDSFEVGSALRSNPGQSAVAQKDASGGATPFDDDDDAFGDFDDSNETDFFNGRMSQQFDVDPELMKAKKGSKTTVILIAILVIVIALVVFAIVK